MKSDGPVFEVYRAELARRGFLPDEGQQPGLEALDRCEREWRSYKSRRTNAITRRLVHPPLPRGVYLWGGVGRGKSFLMDCFFKAVPLERKLRIHFHEFMRAAHREMHDLRGTPDPLGEVAVRIARRYRLICFDEFHISDIADAMILDRLLRALIRARVGFVMTSNYPPMGLYPDGLHRDRLVPALELLQDTLEVVELGHATDFRSRAEDARLAPEVLPIDTPDPVYVTPPGPKADDLLERVFSHLADGPREQNPQLTIESRVIPARASAGRAIWFDFAVLCGGPRSQNDYLELSQRYHSVVLSGIPQMSSGQAAEARRFTWLIDILYDASVRLDASAEVAPELIYTQGLLAGEFQRTASRLREMQTRSFLARSHRLALERFTG